MNIEFRELFGVEISLIPLKDTGNIVCGNAALINWDDACPAATGGETTYSAIPHIREAQSKARSKNLIS